MSKVSVILCHHLPENRKYLDACLRSLDAQVNADIEVILVTGKYEPEGIPAHIKRLHVSPEKRWVNKVNLAIPHTDPASKYFLILNDDVILSKTCISRMVAKLGGSHWIMNPMSTCDNGFLYATQISLTRGDMRAVLGKRFYQFEELAEAEKEIIEYESKLDLLVIPPYVCFYCTMIPRAVWERVGELDEGCHSSHDDEDYCKRAAKLGIFSVVDMSAFALHFGGATSSKEDTDEDRRKTLEYFQAKWGKPV